MLISEYIQKLLTLQQAHGDIEVHTSGVMGHRIEAPAPTVAAKCKLKGREHKPKFWYTFDGEDRKGEAVVRI